MKHFRKPLLLTVIAASLGMGGMVNARADAMSQSILKIEDFKLLNAGGAAFKDTDFSFLMGTNTATETASLNGVPSFKTKTVTILSGSNVLGRACVGTCQAPPGPFDPFPTPPPVPGTFGDADASIVGNAIDVVSPATPAGVTAQTRADAVIATNGSSANTSTVGTDTRFQFKLATPGTMKASFFGTPFLQAYLGAGSGPLDDAKASVSWSISIRDLTTKTSMLDYSPGDLNTTRSETSGGPAIDDWNPGKLFFSATSLALNDVDLYELTISQTSVASADVAAVPEPATLSIFGLGMLGMFAMQRRRRS